MPLPPKRFEHARLRGGALEPQQRGALHHPHAAELIVGPHRVAEALEGLVQVRGKDDVDGAELAQHLAEDLLVPVDLHVAHGVASEAEARLGDAREHVAPVPLASAGRDPLEARLERVVQLLELLDEVDHRRVRVPHGPVCMERVRLVASELRCVLGPGDGVLRPDAVGVKLQRPERPHRFERRRRDPARRADLNLPEVPARPHGVARQERAHGQHRLHRPRRVIGYELEQHLLEAPRHASTDPPLEVELLGEEVVLPASLEELMVAREGVGEPRRVVRREQAGEGQREEHQREHGVRARVAQRQKHAVAEPEHRVEEDV